MNGGRLEELATAAERLQPNDGLGWVLTHERYRECAETAFRTTQGSVLVRDPEGCKPITHLHMGVYHARHTCGTVGCLGGMTVQMWPDESRAIQERHPGCRVDQVAQRILELSDEETEALLHATGADTLPLESIQPEQAASACRRLARGDAPRVIWKDRQDGDDP